MLIRVNADSTGRDILLRIGEKETPFLAGPLNERSATISPDGRLVLYVSDETGRDEVYVRPLATVGSVPVSVAGGSEPRWGPSGREAFYWAGDSLYSVPISMASAPTVGVRRVVHVGEYFRETFHSNYDVAPDGRTFVFVRRASQHRSSVTVLVNWLPKAIAAGTDRAPR